MVDSTLYAANPDNTNWKQVGTGAQAKKGTHAEITAYNEGKPKSKSNVLMFVQDGAPCEECHPKFRELSRAGTESFIFCITGAGYVVHLDLASGDKIGGMHAPMTNAKANEKHLNQIIMNKWYKLDADHIPAVIYYHAGSVFLDAKPINFPAHPPLLAGYG